MTAKTMDSTQMLKVLKVIFILSLATTACEKSHDALSNTPVSAEATPGADKTNTVSLINIDTVPAGKEPVVAGQNNIAAVSDTLFFVDFYGDLWQTQGTSESLRRVAIAGDQDRLQAEQLFALGDRLAVGTPFGLWIVARDPDQWVAKLATPGVSFPIDNVFALGKSIYFTGFDQDGDRNIWQTDESTTGAHRLDITEGCYFFNVVSFQGFIYFTNTKECELWVTDGTAANSHRVSDDPNSVLNNLYKLHSVGGKLFFNKDRELYQYDGSTILNTRLPTNASSVVASGDGKIFAFCPDDGGATSLCLLKENGERTLLHAAGSGIPRAASRGVFFQDNTNTTWFTDGISVQEVNAPALQGYSTVVLNDVLYGAPLFTLGGLFRVDTATLLTTNNTLDAGSSPKAFAQFQGKTYFEATDAAGIDHFYFIDGTVGDPHLAKFTPPVRNNTFLGVFNGRMIFVGNLLPDSWFIDNVLVFGGDGDSLWSTDGTAAGTTLLLHNFSSQRGPGLLTTNGIVFDYDNGLIRTDGTASGTVVLSEEHLLAPKGHSLNGIAYFLRLRDGAIISTDGSNITELLPHRGTPTSRYRSVIPIGAINNGVLVSMLQEDMAGSLWFENGTSTRLVEETDNFIVTDGLVYKGAFYFGGGGKLWKSDSTPDGTKAIVDLCTRCVVAENTLTLFNNVLYFLVRDDVGQMALWRTNGTASGTAIVRALPTNSSRSYFLKSLGVVDSAVFFQIGSQVWKCDGTRDGTKQINSATRKSPWYFIAESTVTSDGLLLSANDGEHGTELWMIR